ncbi:uncharacterized protein RCH25_025432 [Pelodytes ibericus]
MNSTPPPKQDSFTTINQTLLGLLTKILEEDDFGRRVLFFRPGSCTESKLREKRVAVLDTTDIPAASVDLSQFNFTDLVNGMLSKAFQGAKNFFSFLSVTSYSSMAFHKVSILIYNISNLKYVDYHRFPMRYCYCLNNRTNDLADYTVLLLDIVGNSTSSLKELFKSTSIVSVSQSNESDCIYFCVMTGRTGRNLSDLWDLTKKPPIINVTFPQNYSSVLDVESILPNLITSSEDREFIMDIPKELWTLKTTTRMDLDPNKDPEHKLSPTKRPAFSESHSISFTSEISSGPVKTLDSTLLPLTQGLPSKGQSIRFTKLSSWLFGATSKEEDSKPTKSPHLAGSIVPQRQHHSSEKGSLFPQNALKEHSISFSSHKAQEGPYLKLPEWTTLTALEMLERPYSVVPFWTVTGSKVEEASSLTSIPTPRGLTDVVLTQTDFLSKTSALTKNKSSAGLSPTVAFALATSTVPSKYGISSTNTPSMENSVAMGEQDLAKKRLTFSQSTVWKRRDITSMVQTTSAPPGTPLPQVHAVASDGNKMSTYVYTQSRCLQAKLAATSPSITLLFQKVNPCVMELCSFYHQCLCLSQEKYSRHQTQRHCIHYYSWYLKNASFICEKVKRNSHTRKTANAQESGLSPVMPDISDLPLRNINNLTFNGVFKNVESVASFLDCLGSHFTWLQNIFTNFPALLNFVSKLKCVTGLCPKDLEDYGCACRYEMEGLPIDEADSCCFQHRKCYEEALELDCTWDPAKITADVSCLSKNLTCESGEACEKVLCACDKAAIECLVTSQINSSMKGIDTTFCPALVTDFPETVMNNEMAVEAKETGFKMAEITVHSAVSPVTTVTEIQESLERVCDSFNFYQREDGNVKAELPLLGEMLFCLTGRCPEEFEAYGCYCGQEGKGNPADILDSCCFSHQCCLDHLKKLGCQSDRNLRSEVFCVDNKPTCVGWSICDRLLCACDKAAAECMASAPYNETIRALDRNQCQDNMVLCRDGDIDKPDRAIPAKSDSSSSEESSEEISPMRDIVRAGRLTKPNSGSPGPRARPPMSTFVGE